MTSRILAAIATLLLLCNLSACATAPSDPAERAEFDRVNDPLEPTNRAIFEFNQFVDRILLKPIAKTYRYVTPDFVQDALGNVLNNSGEPVRMVNALLQGRVRDAHKIFNRFMVNTTAGLGGMIDMGSESDLGPVHADFGQTLHVWGMPEGPFLMLPLLGPSNPRDAIGFAVDTVAQPYGYIAQEYGGVGTANRYTVADLGGTMVDKRTKALDALDALEKGSLDFYAQLRSVSRQYRNKQLGVSQKVEGSEYDMEPAPGKAAPAKKPMKKHKKVKPAAPKAPVAPATKPGASLTPTAPVAVLAEEMAPAVAPATETKNEVKKEVAAPTATTPAPAAPVTASTAVAPAAIAAAPATTAVATAPTTAIAAPPAVVAAPAAAEVPAAAPIGDTAPTKAK